jgi:hypothetical protein
MGRSRSIFLFNIPCRVLFLLNAESNLLHDDCCFLAGFLLGGELSAMALVLNNSTTERPQRNDVQRR